MGSTHFEDTVFRRLFSDRALDLPTITIAVPQRSITLPTAVQHSGRIRINTKKSEYWSANRKLYLKQHTSPRKTSGVIGRMNGERKGYGGLPQSNVCIVSNSDVKVFLFLRKGKTIKKKSGAKLNTLPIR